MADADDDIDYDFASKTTMHGVQRLVEQRRRSYKVVWVIIIASAVLFCGWEVGNRIKTYLDYNVNTAISIEYPNNMTFPAVTVCNFNRYRLSKISESDEEYLTCALYDTGMDSGSYAGHATAEQLEYCKEWLNTTSFNSTEFTERTSFDLDAETLWSCQFRGIKCDATNFTSVTTDYGRCWTFNGISDNAVKQVKPGCGNGLYLMINVAQYEYSESLKIDYISMDAGLRVLVHPQDTPPAIYESGFAVGTGMHAYAAVSVTEYDNLEEPWGQCKEDQQLKYYKTYSYDSCIMECEMDRFVEECGCKLERYKGPNRICEPTEIHCISRMIAEITNNELDCDCYSDCYDITYDTRLSYANVPSDSIATETEEYFDATAGFMKNNVVLLDVYYSEIVKQVYKQTKAMTSSALLSDIGGQLGLFVGMSFITLIEITEYLTMKIKRYCTRGKKHAKNTQNKVDNAKRAEENMGQN